MHVSILRKAGGPRPYAQSRPVSLEEVDPQRPRAGELLVDIIYASLCHSDLSVVDGSRVRPLPMALGHEAVARVKQVGDAVTGVRPGERVVLVFVPSCRQCRSCLRGAPALCERAAAVNGSGDLLHGPRVLRSAAGEAVHHHLGVSAFADSAVVAAESAVVIPDDLPDEVAALFGCAVLTGMGAVLHTGAARAGDSVAVYGLGAVGLAAVMAARVAGASVVLAVDPNEGKHASALAAGATHVAVPQDAAELIARLTEGGMDLAVEAAGAAAVIEACLSSVGRGGAVVSVGLPRPEATFTSNALQFAGSGKRLLGSYMGDADPVRDIPRYVDLWREGRLPLEVLHTDTRPLAELNEGLDALADGLVIRRLFRPTTGDV